jgi:hypothetical protein
MKMTSRNLIFGSALAAALGAFAAAKSWREQYNDCSFDCTPVLASLRAQAHGAQLYRGWLARDAADVADLSLVAKSLPASRRGPGEPEVVFAPGVTDSARRATLAALTLERGARGEWRGKGRVVVIVANNEDLPVRPAAAPSPRPVRRRVDGDRVITRFIPPSAATGDRCVVVVRLAGTSMDRGPMFRRARPLMDACAFYDAFGAPGGRVAALLDRGLYAAARVYAPSIDDVSQVDAHAIGDALRSDERTSGAACLGGSAGDCEALVLSTLSDSIAPRPTAAASGIRVPFPLEAGPSRIHALQALVDAVGPADFARVWSSDDSLQVSFRREHLRPLADIGLDAARRVAIPGFYPTGFGSRATIESSREAMSAALVVAFLVGAGWIASAASRRPRVAR